MQAGTASHERYHLKNTEGCSLFWFPFSSAHKSVPNGIILGGGEEGEGGGRHQITALSQGISKQQSSAGMPGKSVKVNCTVLTFLSLRVIMDWTATTSNIHIYSFQSPDHCTSFFLFWMPMLYSHQSDMEAFLHETELFRSLLKHKGTLRIYNARIVCLG